AAPEAFVLVGAGAGQDFVLLGSVGIRHGIRGDVVAGHDVYVDQFSERGGGGPETPVHGTRGRDVRASASVVDALAAECVVDDRVVQSSREPVAHLAAVRSEEHTSA